MRLSLCPWKRAFHLKLAGIQEVHRLKAKRAHRSLKSTYSASIGVRA